MESNSTIPPMEEATMLTATDGNSSLAILNKNLTALYWVTLCISILGFIINGVVVWLLVFQIKKNPFSIYFLNLAIADFLFLICVFCLSIFFLMKDELFTKGKNIAIHSTQLIMLFGYTTGLYLLTAISVERCLAVLFPIWYKCHRSQHKSTVVCILIWIVTFLVIPMELVFDHLRPLIYFISNVVHCGVFIPLMILSALFLVVKVRKTSVKSPSYRLYVVIVSSISIFLFLAMPIRLCIMFLHLFDSDFDETLYHISIFLSSLNSSINPLVYFFVGSKKKKRFRESMKVALSRAFQDNIGPDGLETCAINTLNATT